MSPGDDYTMLEVLGVAIKSEVEAVKLYTRMKELAKNPDLIEKIDFLIDQEKKHEKLLTEAYKKKFPETDLRLPKKSLVPTISAVLEKDATLKELFEAGIEAERKSEDFYTDLAGKTRDSNSKSTLEYLASMERSHLSILETEYRQLERGEDYNSDDYLRGERLMNLGP
jgi:rubrerythrin